MFKQALLWFFLFLFVALCATAFYRHHNRPIYTYQSELWADKGGYYIYLPATFIYSFQGEHLPDSINYHMGEGFRVNIESGKIETKYYYGVAWLWLPFFAGAHLLAPTLGYEANGFTAPYHKMMNIAGPFYAVLALLFLFLFLRKRLNPSSAALLLALSFFGSNAFYYTIDENGMTHIYSFFLFAVILYSFDLYVWQRKTIHILYVALAFGLLTFIRPTNFLFGAMALFVGANSKEAFSTRFQLLLIPKNALLFVGSLALFFLPQSLYWHFINGRFFSYPYKEEGFSNWLNPDFAMQWFDPHNGLIVYGPAYALLFIFVLRAAFVKHNPYGVIFIVLASYVFASWWAPLYGCSFGQRSFVDLLPVFIVLSAEGLSGKWQKSSYSLGFAFLTLGCSYYSIKLSFLFNECYFAWPGDWSHFTYLLTQW
jgi:hypothetical protein